MTLVIIDVNDPCIRPVKFSTKRVTSDLYGDMIGVSASQEHLDVSVRFGRSRSHEKDATGKGAFFIEKVNEVCDIAFQITEYGPEGEVAAVSFRMLYNDVMISFRLPAHVDSIYVIMQNEKGVQRKHRSRDHARRIAWRIIKDWVEAQLALVEAEQAEMVEVFLPYAQDPQTGETIFKKLARSDFKLLGGSI